jgi:membrane protease YdiL (CAAX protease family)
MPTSVLSPKRDRGHLPTAAILGAACVVATLLEFPYSNALSPMPAALGGPAIAAVEVFTAVVLGGGCFLLAWIGLAAGARLGLDSPLLRGRAGVGATRTFAIAALVGVVLGAAIVAAIHVFPSLQVPAVMPHAARWQGALASVGGGISEEVMTRLFLMTAVAWVLVRLTKRRGTSVFVVAAVVSALAFGALHLPQASMLFGGLTAPIVVSTLLGNGVLGVAFGMIYKRWGLEHAMLAHFAADLVLHVVFVS